MARIGKPLSGRPLYAVAADRELYVARPLLEERLDRAIRRDLNVLIVGDRGAGKTTLLQQLLYKRREADTPTVYVDASIARTALDVIDLLRDQVGLAPHVGENMTAGLRSLVKPGAAGAREASLLLERLRPLRELDPALVLVDGFNDAEIAHILFGRLRDELWALPLTWVVASGREQRSRFLTPPADAFWETVIEVPAFDPDEQAELLRRRFGDEWRRVRGLIDHHEANPRHLLNAARQVIVEGHPVENLLRNNAARETRFAQLGRAPRAAYGEIEAMDRPVAASDDELLRRLGVTRERAGQMLNQLEEAGLLDSFHEPMERGRPRKLYRIRDTLGEDQQQ